MKKKSTSTVTTSMSKEAAEAWSLRYGSLLGFLREGLLAMHANTRKLRGFTDGNEDAADKIVQEANHVFADACDHLAQLEDGVRVLAGGASVLP